MIVMRTSLGTFHPQQSSGICTGAELQQSANFVVEAALPSIAASQLS
jgi:hypothetical protein